MQARTGCFIGVVWPIVCHLKGTSMLILSALVCLDQNRLFTRPQLPMYTCWWATCEFKTWIMMGVTCLKIVSTTSVHREVTTVYEINVIFNFGNARPNNTWRYIWVMGQWFFTGTERLVIS